MRDMNTCYAVLIDGGFAKRKLGTAPNPATAETFDELVKRIAGSPELAASRLHRVYYYDSMPLESSAEKPLEGGSLEFGKQEIVGRSKKLFSMLSRLPMFAVRLGELSFNGWTVNYKKLARAQGKQLAISADDLKPAITQKGVDMRIGMDIAALSLKKQVQIIVLVTGDSDFVPCMKFARREGTQLYLVHLGHRVKDSMYEHSDRVIDVDPRPLLEISKVVRQTAEQQARAEAQAEAEAEEVLAHLEKD